MNENIGSTLYIFIVVYYDAKVNISHAIKLIDAQFERKLIQSCKSGNDRLTVSLQPRVIILRMVWWKGWLFLMSSKIIGPQSSLHSEIS